MIRGKEIHPGHVWCAVALLLLELLADADAAQEDSRQYAGHCPFIGSFPHAQLYDAQQLDSSPSSLDAVVRYISNRSACSIFGGPPLETAFRFGVHGLSEWQTPSGYDPSRLTVAIRVDAELVPYLGPGNWSTTAAIDHETPVFFAQQEYTALLANHTIAFDTFTTTLRTRELVQCPQLMSTRCNFSAVGESARVLVRATTLVQYWNESSNQSQFCDVPSTETSVLCDVASPCSGMGTSRFGWPRFWQTNRAAADRLVARDVDGVGCLCSVLTDGLSCGWLHFPRPAFVDHDDRSSASSVYYGQLMQYAHSSSAFMQMEYPADIPLRWLWIADIASTGSVSVQLPFAYDTIMSETHSALRMPELMQSISPTNGMATVGPLVYEVWLECSFDGSTVALRSTTAQLITGLPLGGKLFSTVTLSFPNASTLVESILAQGRLQQSGVGVLFTLTNATIHVALRTANVGVTTYVAPVPRNAIIPAVLHYTFTQGVQISIAHIVDTSCGAAGRGVYNSALFRCEQCVWPWTGSFCRTSRQAKFVAPPVGMPTCELWYRSSPYAVANEMRLVFRANLTSVTTAYPIESPPFQCEDWSYDVRCDTLHAVGWPSSNASTVWHVTPTQETFCPLNLQDNSDVAQHASTAYLVEDNSAQLQPTRTVEFLLNLTAATRMLPHFQELYLASYDPSKQSVDEEGPRMPIMAILSAISPAQMTALFNDSSVFRFALPTDRYCSISLRPPTASDNTSLSALPAAISTLNYTYCEAHVDCGKHGMFHWVERICVCDEWWFGDYCDSIVKPRFVSTVVQPPWCQVVTDEWYSSSVLLNRSTGYPTLRTPDTSNVSEWSDLQQSFAGVYFRMENLDTLQNIALRAHVDGVPIPLSTTAAAAADATRFPFQLVLCCDNRSSVQPDAFHMGLTQHSFVYHNETQEGEFYLPLVYRAGAAVDSTTMSADMEVAYTFCRVELHLDGAIIDAIPLPHCAALPSPWCSSSIVVQSQIARVWETEWPTNLSPTWNSTQRQCIPCPTGYFGRYCTYTEATYGELVQSFNDITWWNQTLDIFMPEAHLTDEQKCALMTSVQQAYPELQHIADNGLTTSILAAVLLTVGLLLVVGIILAVACCRQKVHRREEQTQRDRIALQKRIARASGAKDPFPGRDSDALSASM